MEICLDDIKNNKMGMNLSVYPDEVHDRDIVGDDNYFDKVREEFGMHHIRGTAIGFHNPDTGLVWSTERLFRSFLHGSKHTVEIGTWRGVSTALLAHYAEKVTTIDVTYYPEAMPVWLYFGVKNKIKQAIVENNEAKKNLVERLDFDFAFIDGMHTFEEVAYDFELVKKCGRVLFHDWGIDHCPGVTKFVKTLPQEQFSFRRPFALWVGK